MSPERLELLLARERLRERIAHQREQLAAAAWPIETACSAADTVADAGRWLRAHAGVVAGGLVGLLIVRPRAAWRWGRRLFAGWRLWTALRRRFESAVGTGPR